jgi:hypothetical protein
MSDRANASGAEEAAAHAELRVIEAIADRPRRYLRAGSQSYPSPAAGPNANGSMPA